MDSTPLLAVLLKDNSVHVINPLAPKTASLLYSVNQNYSLYSGLILVVIIFVANEFGPQNVISSNRLFISLLYFLFGSMIINILSE